MLVEEAEEQEEQKGVGEEEEEEEGERWWQQRRGIPTFLAARPTQSDRYTLTEVCWGSAGRSSDLSAPRRSTHSQGQSQKRLLGMRQGTK